MELQRKHATPPRKAAVRGGPPAGAHEHDELPDNSLLADQLGEQEGLETEQEAEQSGPFTPTLNALLGAAFGASLGGLDASFGQRSDNQAMGAEASTEGGAMSFGAADLDLSDPEAMDTVAHETAHALAGPGTGETALDQPGDRGEQGAEEAGRRFGDWAARGFTGPAPALKPAAGGQAEVHRKASATATLDGDPALRKGSSGSEVKLLQQLLNRYGEKLDADGEFGAKTEAAVLRFQAKYGLDADGIVGPKTAAALYANLTTNSTTSSGSTLTGSPALQQGQKSDQVKTLQTLLNQYGASLTVDGDFGAKTLAAVKAFQSANGLDADGVVGPKTAAMLTSGTAAKIPAESKTTTTGSDTKVSVGNADPGGRLNSSNVNPTVKKLAQETIQNLQAQGLSPYVVDGFRSFERQDELYNSGKGVTKVKGGGSWHNYGLAVDIAFWNSKGTAPTWDAPSSSWAKLGAAGKKAGFTEWGGDWGWDMPHLEYHPKWTASAYKLADTYRSSGLQAVWTKVGA